LFYHLDYDLKNFKHTIYLFYNRGSIFGRHKIRLVGWDNKANERWG